MPRCVSYRITDRPDGLFDAVVTIEPDKVMRRDGFSSLAEVEEWVDGLRVLMGSLGASVTREDEQAGYSVPVGVSECAGTGTMI